MIEANRFVNSERALRIDRALSLLLIKKKQYVNLGEKGYTNHKTDFKYTCILE